MAKPLLKPDWMQLSLIGESVRIPEEDDSAAPEEARARSEAALTLLKARFTGSELPEWWATYERLRLAGWRWPVAVYIAWASSPVKGRIPRTQEELAQDYLGLASDRQIWAWRQKNPVIDETIGILQAEPIFERRADIIKALVDSATTPDYKNAADRRTALVMTGDYNPRVKVDVTRRKLDAEEMSDEELRKQAALAESEDESAALTASEYEDGDDDLSYDDPE